MLRQAWPRIVLFLAVLFSLRCSTVTSAPGGLLISCLVYEDVGYVRATIKNLAHLTHSSTHVLVHVSWSVTWWKDTSQELPEEIWEQSNHLEDGRRRWLELDPPTRARFHVNPDHGKTRRQTGKVLRQHLSNFAFARRIGLIGGSNSSFTHVMMHASTSRFIFPGVEQYVRRHGFNTLSHQGWLDVRTVDTPTHCSQAGTDELLKLDPPMVTSAAHFFCSARPHFDSPCSGPGPDKGTIEGKPCIRMSFSAHEGAFFPVRVALGAMDFFAATPLDMRLYGSSEASVLEPRFLKNRSHPPSLLDWLPHSMGKGGSAAEEIWIQTFLWHTAEHRGSYLASNHAPPTSTHWTQRSDTIGICEALAIIKQRNHTVPNCQYPVAIKRWGGKGRSLPENEMWFDCLWRRGRDLIEAWTGSPQDWAQWEMAAGRCFYEVNNATRFVETNPLLVNCDYEDPRVQRAVLKSVYKRGTIPYGKSLRCLKSLHDTAAAARGTAAKFSMREWGKARREEAASRARAASMAPPAAAASSGSGG